MVSEQQVQAVPGCDLLCFRLLREWWLLACPSPWSTVFGSWYFLAMPMRTLMLLPKHRCLGSGVGLDPKSSNLTLLRPGLSRKGREVVEEL